jgi:glycosyltransferase involved in cell wall biosynthesis
MVLADVVSVISVILPTCDRPSLLTRAVESVLRQSDVGFELLIVDNNRSLCPVGEAPEAARWRRDPRIRILRAAASTNASSARNVGLENARGEWIAFLDDDDAYRPRKLARQLEKAGPSPIVLCGADFHMRGRSRLVQVSDTVFRGDDLLTRASWGTPFLMHRSLPGHRFDEGLDSGEDVLYALGAVARLNVGHVPVAAEPLVDVYQDRIDTDRTNIRGEAGWRAARRALAQFGRRYSRNARRLFLLRALIARAKLQGKALTCAALTPALIRAGGCRQARYAANAVLVGTGLGGNRWVT